MLVREEAHQLLLEAADSDFGYEAFQDDEANAEAIERWRAWFATRE